MKYNTMKVLFSSEDMTWETPQAFFDKLDLEFKFNLDPCASPNTAKCTKYFTEEDDGLAQDWSGHTVFCNPPYGRGIKKWIQKAHQESLKPNTKVVLLIPSRTDTSYWHDYVMKAREIRFVRGRLKFGNAKNSAPFPSAVVVFDYNDTPTITTMEV